MNRPLKHLPPLPAERALKVIAGRGKAVLLYQLFDGPLRLSALSRRLPGLSQKVLIQQLHEMQAHGLVQRLPDAAAPTARSPYAATALGLSLAPVLMALCDWGRQHAAALDDLDRLAHCAPPAAMAFNGRSADRATAR